MLDFFPGPTALLKALRLLKFEKKWRKINKKMTTMRTFTYVKMNYIILMPYVYNFFPNFPVPTFIPCPMFIPDSRVQPFAGYKMLNVCYR